MNFTAGTIYTIWPCCLKRINKENYAMIDIRLIRETPDEVKAKIKRGKSILIM